MYPQKPVATLALPENVPAAIVVNTILNRFQSYHRDSLEQLQEWLADFPQHPQATLLTETWRHLKSRGKDNEQALLLLAYMIASELEDASPNTK